MTMSSLSIRCAWSAFISSLLLIVVLGSGSTTAQAQTISRLPALGIRPDAVTVGGLSSGAYMAVQFEIAYSASLAGAAVLEGGPYGCSSGSLATALLTCSCPDDFGIASAAFMGCSVPPEAFYVSRAQRSVKDNRQDIDDPANLARHRVWLFSGGSDRTVDPRIVAAMAASYRALGVPAANIDYKAHPTAGHGLPNPLASTPCANTQSPWIINCGNEDAPIESLRWIYADNGQLPPPGQVDATSLKVFRQTGYSASGKFDGLDAEGWVYVPIACIAQGANCRLHVVFHGCLQAKQFLGDGFVRGAGYNRWAEATRTVVLYPQIKPSTRGGFYLPYQYNPKGCWDFWGYTNPAGNSVLTGSKSFATRDAPQMRAVKKMIDDLVRAR